METLDGTDRHGSQSPSVIQRRVELQKAAVRRLEHRYDEARFHLAFLQDRLEFELAELGELEAACLDGRTTLDAAFDAATNTWNTN